MPDLRVAQAGPVLPKPGLLRYPALSTACHSKTPAEVLSLSEATTVPAGSFAGCLQTLEYTPIDPGVFEQKFYASGVGLVLEVNVETNERIELIEFTIP